MCCVKGLRTMSMRSKADTSRALTGCLDFDPHGSLHLLMRISAVFSHLFRNLILCDPRHPATNLAIPLNHQNLGKVTGITTSTRSDSFPEMMLFVSQRTPDPASERCIPCFIRHDCTC